MSCCPRRDIPTPRPCLPRFRRWIRTGLMASSTIRRPASVVRSASRWQALRRKTRGGQHGYSDLAIETTLTLGLAFGLRLRQTEGWLESVLQLMGLVLAVPDHTTPSRRARTWQSANKRHIAKFRRKDSACSCQRHRPCRCGTISSAATLIWPPPQLESTSTIEDPPDMVSVRSPSAFSS
ncbi:hypothetical protein MPLSOD_410042 [Mesorhizobium sp. SOD10]|nr:hypothetical protein MPLSOD_410042 [Mesorhizobium sp. SOD10]